MSKNVSNAQILQAITELTDQVQKNSQKTEETNERLSRKIEETDQKIENTEGRLTEKIDKLDSKLSVLSDSLLKTQAEVKILKNAESS